MRYSKKTLEYFHHPKNVGRFECTDSKISIGIAGTKENGEIIEIQIKVENNIIKDSKFLAHGGVVVIASMRWITEWLKGKTIFQAEQITEREISAALEIPQAKKHAILLAIEAVRSVLNNFKIRTEK